jgi:pyruvate/2-oxoglutarate dehydrogenase complex dihydrolipoamide acyltransferase (E2) component
VTSLRTEATVDVTMPQMGVSVAEGTIAAWRKAVGDAVAADETICEITTDKIDTEVPAPVAGTVTEILAGVDETVEVGTVIARIATGGGGGDAGPAGDGAPDAAGEVGATEAAAALDPPSDTAAPQPDADDAPSADDARDAPPTGEAPPTRRRYSPVVMRIAGEHGIDLASVTGTGRDGRVRKQDVLALVEAPDAPAESEPPLHIESPYRPDPAPAAATAGVPRGEPLSRMRRTIGEHMKRSLDTAATCTTWIEVDVSGIEAVRARYGLTALAYLARCAVLALREHPTLNATLEGDTFTRYDAVHLGIAVSLEDEGLIVPVIRDAQLLSEEGLGQAIRDVARRARARRLEPDEVRGGTFTITNPGQYGSIAATPVISQPQVAILDVEAIVKRPVVVTDAAGDDAIAIRPICVLGLSWDHRALDGVLAARFLATVKKHAESVPR